jgi:cephalosporin hydroxylase
MRIKKILNYIYVYNTPHWIKNLLNLLLLPLYIFLINKNKKYINDFGNAINFVFSFHLLGIFFIQQSRYEIYNLLQILVQKRPKILLEIGSASGGTLFLFCHIASEDATLISLDMDNVLWKKLLFKYFSRGKQKIVVIKGDSHDPKIFNDIKKILGNCKIDFLFHDADHSYEGVKKDFEMYSTLIRKGGIIAFHDIVTNSIICPQGWDVSKFWNEIKIMYNYMEIIERKNQKAGGIGILFV